MAKIKLDFTGVQDGFKSISKPGVYLCKITKVEPKRSSTSNKPYLNWEFEVADGEYKGSKLWFITSLQPQALFNLRNLLICAGLDVPKKVVQIDLDTVVGRMIAAKVVMETYNGELKPKVKEVLEPSSVTVDNGNDFIAAGGEPVSDEEIDLEGLDI